MSETERGFLVAFDLHWHVVESRRVDAVLGAAAALSAFVDEYTANGWTAEGDGSYGFVFVNRDGKRMLLEVTPRDPFDASEQSFSPFK